MIQMIANFFYIRKVLVSTDEGNGSSKPAKSSIRRFKLFRINKGQQSLMAFENLRYETISATQIFNHETI